MRRRSHRVNVWLDDQEYAHLKKQVEESGLGIEAVVRNLVMGLEVKAKPPEQYAGLLRELSAIGNNINQIAHVANRQKYIDKAGLEQAVQLAHQAFRLVKDNL